MTTNPDIPPDLRVCAVCGRPADQTGDGGWLHLSDVLEGTADHPVVPVLPGEVHTVGVCDFCHGPDPAFVVPVQSFTYADAPQVVTPDGVPRHTASNGNWAACAHCAKLIERNDWNGIVRRVAELDPRARLPEVQAALRKMYRQLRANITGSIRPFEWPNPPMKNKGSA